MSIAVSPAYSNGPQTIQGVGIRYGTLAVTGLTAGGDNDVTHGLPAMPTRVWADHGTWSIKLVDSTKVTVTVAAAGATAGNLYCEY